MPFYIRTPIVGEDLPKLPIANHMVLIGIDGLRPDCIAGAPGGAPNIRLGAQVMN